MKTLRSFILESTQTNFDSYATSYDVLMFIAKTVMSESYGDVNSISELKKQKADFIETFTEYVIDHGIYPEDGDDSTIWFNLIKPMKFSKDGFFKRLNSNYTTLTLKENRKVIPELLNKLFESKKPIYAGVSNRSCNGDVTIGFQLCDENEYGFMFLDIDTLTDSFSNDFANKY